ncbi:MFS general substrate transporter [Dentipellis sp. KUC8613]|nr:MFS general substrate transporter [Dentipellis sp. KUC8613]
MRSIITIPSQHSYLLSPPSREMASAPPSHTSTIIEEPHINGDKVDKEGYTGPPENLSNDEIILVEFSDSDPLNPKMWSSLYRWYLTVVSGLLVLNATFASSAPSGVIPQMMEQFDMGTEVATLTISLFTAGYCIGPIFWGPLSEQVGRRPVFLVTFFVYTGFQVGCALSKNTASILVFRFLGGAFAAAPLTNSGAVLGDIWDAKTRGRAMVIFAVTPFAGPALGPTVAGWISTAGVTWRWLFWVLTIFAGACFLLVLLSLPETHPPTILVAKARGLRKDTGDERYRAQTEIDDVQFAQLVENVVAKPFKILFAEPMLMVVTTYMSFLSGCLYLLFEAYPIVFTEGHHFDAGVSGLMFLPIFVGGVLGVLIYLVFFEPRYEKLVVRHAPEPVPAESRLEMTMLGAPLFAISFFWFGWTSYPSISYWSPMLAGGLMGLGIFCIFLSLFNYVIDTYLFVAASALASLTVVRSVFSAVFPLFARQMFDAMNPRWASTLLGFIALLLMPIPFVFQRYGPYLRSKSKYVPVKPVVPTAVEA